MIEKVQAIRYTPSKYQQSQQGEICQEFLKGECRKADKCEFSHEEDGSLHKIKIESGDDVKLKTSRKKMVNCENILRE